MSMGRVGLDFRQMVSDLFEEAIYKLVSTTIQLGTDSFIEKMMGLPNGPWLSKGLANEHDIIAFPGKIR
jgi:hypothetical protein